jgi:hypothetical protein
MQVVVVTKESAPLQCSVSTELYGAQCDVDVVYRCSVPPHFQGDALHCMDSKRSTHSRTQLNLNHIATCKSVRQFNVLRCTSVSSHCSLRRRQ